MERRKKTQKASTPVWGVLVIVTSALAFIMVMNLAVIAVRLVMG